MDSKAELLITGLASSKSNLVVKQLTELAPLVIMQMIAAKQI
jgi:hypothetical protein